MITALREKTVVKKGGKIEISATSFPVGTEVEVIILTETDEQDTTEYLLTNKVNREHLFEAIKDAQNTENLIYVDVENL